MPAYQWHGEDIILYIRVTPGSSNDEFAGIHEDRVKIRLTSPPIDGKANQALGKYLSKLFKVPPSRVVIEKGVTSKNKRVRIQRPNTFPDFIKNP